MGNGNLHKIMALFLAVLLLLGLPACEGKEPAPEAAPSPAAPPSSIPDVTAPPPEETTSTTVPAPPEPQEPKPPEESKPPEETPEEIPEPQRNNDNSAAHHQKVRYGEIEELRECYELATEIGNRHGINIYVGDLVPGWILESGNEPQCEPCYVKRSLLLIDEVLSIYPEGFFDQLVYGDYVGLDLFLAGFLSIGMGYVSSYWAETEEGPACRSFLCLDIEEDGQIDILSYNLAHEITHLIDLRIQWLSAEETGHLYSEEAWDALNPEGFVYAWDDNDLELEMYGW